MTVMLASPLSRFIEGINHSNFFPIVSLILFILVFIGAVIWVLRLSKDFRTRMKNIPFNDENKQNLKEDGK